MQITWDDWCKAVDDMQWMVGDLRQSADSIHCDADYLYSRELKTDHWHSGVESSYQSIRGDAQNQDHPLPPGDSDDQTGEHQAPCPGEAAT